MDRELKFNITAQANKSTFNRAAKELKTLAQAGVIDGDTFKTAAVDLKALNAQLKVTTNEMGKARAELAGLEGDELDKQQAKVLKLEQSYIKLNAQIAEVPNRLKPDQLDYGDLENQARRRGEAFGTLDTSLVTGAGLLSGAGVRGPAQALVGVADVLAVTEQIPLFTQSIKGIGETLRNTGGVIGKLANRGGDLLSVIPGISAGFGSILAVLGPIVAITAGVTIGLQAFSKAQEKIKENAEEYVSLVETRAETLAELTGDVDEGDITGAIEKRQQLLRQRADLEREAAEYEQQRVYAAEARAQEQRGGRGSAGNVLSDLFGTTQLEENLDQLDEKAAETAKELEATNVAIVAADEVFIKAGIDLSATAETIEDTTAKEQELAQERERAQAALDQLTEQESKLIKDRLNAQENLAAERALRDERELADFRDRQEKHFDKLGEIQDDGNKRIAKIEADAATAREKAIAKAAQDSLNIAREADKTIAKAQAEANRDRAKAQAEFYQNQKRAQEDYQRSVFESIVDNNILAARRQQAENRNRAARAQEDFSLEQAERDAQAAQRIADIRAEASERQAALQANLQAELAANREATAQRIKEEKAAVDERLKQEAKAQRELEKEREKRLERQAEDDRIRDEKEQKAFEEQLAAIQRKKQIELEAINQGAAAQIKATNTVTKAVAQGSSEAVTTFGNALSTVVNQFASALGGIKSGKGGATGFASGGIVPPGIGGLGFFEPDRRFAEAVIPLTPSTLDQLAASMSGGLGGQGAPIINWYAPVDGASREEIRGAFNQLVMAFNRGIGQSLRGQ